MEIPIDYVFNVTRDGSFSTQSDMRIVFLCGIVFKRKDPRDKRTVLKNYLQKTSANRVIILEEHFTNTATYGDIDLSNLYDVESLVACFANATIIIHESISTGAELGMLGSTKSTASSLIVLHPDEDSVEDAKISYFIRLAFYGGKEPILSKDRAIPFSPIMEKSFESNDRYTIHTSFPNEFKSKSRAKDNLDAFLDSTPAKPLSSLLFKKARFGKPTTRKVENIDYYQKNGKLFVAISPMALRSLLFSSLTIDRVRDHIEKSTSISKVISGLQNDLEIILLATFKHRLGININEIEVKLKGRAVDTFQDPTTDDYRKATGLFVYLTKALGYLSDEKNKKFKFTKAFTSTRTELEPTISLEKSSSFKIRLNKAGIK